MNFSEDQLKEIEDMAGLFFGADDIAINLELNEEQTELFGFRIDSKNTSFPEVAAYLKGRLTAKIVMRKAIKQSAQNGSSPSQQQMLNFLKESK
ncbi:MAG: hypothetical protein Q8S54_07750 [Bacteroidota bacterium]|nr:hypothetical protein [Bacteroidota bacterium]MDP3643069.1 hypothetical protein [Bacteroidota bacterium]